MITWGNSISMQAYNAYLFALGANLCFSSASLVYAAYSRKISVLWMNCFKAAVAFLALIISITLFSNWHIPSLSGSLPFLVSGILGLNIGDMCLLRAFTILGPGRTLVLFGFHPLLLGLASYFLFEQQVDSMKFVAVVFLIACLGTFSYEGFKTRGHWEVKGLLLALAGVLLDISGIILSRYGFERDQSITPIQGHFYRTGGALLGFAIIGLFLPFSLFNNFVRVGAKDKIVLIIACMAGTFLSLLFYLKAIQIGHLATVSAISITGPLFASALECVVEKRKPSRYLLVALLFFVLGYAVLFKDLLF